MSAPTLSVVYLQMSGPMNALTPAGHRVQYSSAPFDESKTSPEEMAVLVAKKWQKIDAAIEDFELVSTYDVVSGTKAGHQIVYLFVYKPDAEKQVPVIDHFAGSYYLQKRQDTTK